MVLGALSRPCLCSFRRHIATSTLYSSSSSTPPSPPQYPTFSDDQPPQSASPQRAAVEEAVTDSTDAPPRPKKPFNRFRPRLHPRFSRKPRPEFNKMETIRGIAEDIERVLKAERQPKSILKEDFHREESLSRTTQKLGRGQTTRRLPCSRRKDTFVNISKVLSHPLLFGRTFKEVEEVMRMDPAKRLELLYEPRLGAVVGGLGNGVNEAPWQDRARLAEGGWWIRLKEDVSQDPTDRLRRITHPDELSEAIYVAGASEADFIRKQGLSSASPSNPWIHLYTKPPGPAVLGATRTGPEYFPYKKTLNPLEKPFDRDLLPHTRSAKRKNTIQTPLCTEEKVFVCLSIKTALAHGIKFWISKVDPRIVLTKGNDLGYIPSECFRWVRDIKVKRSVIWRAEQPPPSEPQEKTTRPPRKHPRTRSQLENQNQV